MDYYFDSHPLDLCPFSIRDPISGINPCPAILNPYLEFHLQELHFPLAVCTAVALARRAE